MVAKHDDTGRLQLAAEIQRAYADALLAGEPPTAERVIREAIDSGLGEAEIDDHVIRPAMRMVGDLWADGRLTVAEEHLATSISLRVVALQREAFRVARERVAQRVLLAGAQDERHVVGLEMAASLLLHAGYDVRLLGADLPVAEVATAVRAHRPAVCGFTTASALSAGNLPSTFAAVHDASPEASILVGGLGADGSWASMWGVVVCDHVTDAVEHVDALIRRASHN